MPYAIYKIIHLVGIVMALTALGALAFSATNGDANPNKRKIAVITHGVGLVLALVSGFGLMARLGLSFGDNLWIFGKLAIWLVVGGLLAVVKRKPEKAAVIWWLIPVLVGLAAWMAVYKPF